VRLGLKVDQLFRERLYRQMDAVVTFSDAERIFGQRTIRISNGVDFDSIPLHLPPLSSERAGGEVALHLIGVAEVHPWHGFDRVMTGIGEYYRQKPNANSQQPNVFFHVVGGVHPHRMKTDFEPIIRQYGLQDRVIFHGQLFGEELTKVFNQCQFAIGSLGRHRSGITVIKTLKNREYATRGIPFVYSEQDSDFDHQPYVLKAPADESPLDIQTIIDFMDHFTMKPEEIRKTVEHLAWRFQMQKVIEAVKNSNMK
jgi:glycosyltransferase involved in cell wall biosynthesis